MRPPALLIAAAVLVATPALAQDAGLQHRLFELQAQVDLARQRDIATQNEITALDARLRTEQAVREVQAARIRPPIPVLPYPLSPAAAAMPLSTDFPSIPDDRLAASNAAVADAANNRR